MDKRFFLALLLAGLVLMVGQLIFPTTPKQSPAVHPGVNAGDTVRASAQANTTAASTPSAAKAVPAPPARTDSLAAAAARSSAAPVAGDTVTVATSKAVYRFSTVGATPITVRLHDYRSLSAADGNVELVRPGVPLVDYRLRLGSDTISLDRLPFTVDSAATTAANTKSLTFRTTVGGATVAITYTLVPDRYLMDVRGQVQGVSARDGELLITLPDGLKSNEADSTDDHRNLAFVTRLAKEGDVKSFSFSKLAKLDSGESQIQSAPLSWVASKSKYFLVALIADRQPFTGAVLSPRGMPRTATSQSAVVFAPIAADGHFAFRLYTGPQEWRRLVALGQDFTHVNSYGGIFGPIIEPFTVIVMQVLLWMHNHLAITYGWVVVIFGVGFRLILWPLNQKAMRTSLRMQRLQPELQALQKKHKNNPEKQHAEMMRLYKEHNMSPFSPLSGCLPMLIPMPILYALYFVFENTIAFRGVPFLWMADIAQKDPYYILPILMGISMFVLSWIGLRTAPPNAQTKMMGYFFPVLMTVFFFRLPAGLNLYYAVQNMAALPQQWLIAKERAKVGTPAKTEGASLVRR